MSITLFSVLFGLVIGSFANVCIFRLPHDQSIRWPRSYCPHCKKSLYWWHNVPIFSYLALRGRCYFCRQTISWRYPLLEGVMAGLFLFHAWAFSPSVDKILFADVLGFYVLTISIIDYQHRIIPDELSYSLLIIGLASFFMNPYLPGTTVRRLTESSSAMLGGGLLMLGLGKLGEIIFKKEALGGGDVKLIAAFGAFMGWQGIFGSLFMGSLTGGLAAVILIFLKKKKLGETLPFGPFLCLGAYVSYLYPEWKDVLLFTDLSQP